VIATSATDIAGTALQGRPVTGHVASRDDPWPTSVHKVTMPRRLGRDLLPDAFAAVTGTGGWPADQGWAESEGHSIRLGHTTIGETMDAYGHLFPDDDDLGRGTFDALFAAHVPSQCPEKVEQR
jgi:hypothetical protein